MSLPKEFVTDSDQKIDVVHFQIWMTQRTTYPRFPNDQRVKAKWQSRAKSDIPSFLCGDKTDFSVNFYEGIKTELKISKRWSSRDSKWKISQRARNRGSKEDSWTDNFSMSFLESFFSFWKEIWSVTHFYQDTFEILAYRHAAQFDAEVANLESWPFGFNLRLLLTGVDSRHFHHQQIEQAVRYQWHHFAARLEEGEHWGWLLRIVQHMHGPLNACKVTSVVFKYKFCYIIQQLYVKLYKE